MATQNSDILLSVDNLDVIYDTDDPVHAVQNATFELRRGEMLGLAGESGCGKSTLAYSINQMLKAPGKINSGSVIFHDKSGKILISVLCRGVHCVNTVGRKPPWCFKAP
mgnify:FL=1